ncbi:hypothetical protein HYALB_00009082 [Hymenoscyphus albidus]|uniref:Copper transport protein n=1 Tax=Hymenoscyphus albidus TaxID=595503 RepID=A0A9N9LN79_9HELO|nr:hypothetical protein HYALB_00009082 [Hymenoscyphus albidus]
MDMAKSITMGISMGGTMTTADMAAMTSKPSMGMGMGGGSGCKISMLWNWYTIDACFISHSWHITTPGMFAGSCIGVILLVISLEFLRRVSREYDRFLSTHYSLSSPSPSPSANSTNCNPSSSPSSSSLHTANKYSSTTNENGAESKGKSTGKGNLRGSLKGSLKGRRYKPTLLEQAIRATLHMIQFTIAYFIMLLAMYYNGDDSDKAEATYCCGYNNPINSKLPEIQGLRVESIDDAGIIGGKKVISERPYKTWLSQKILIMERGR